MNVYLAGPMRGYPRYNFPAFAAACVQLRAADYEVWSPHERHLDEGFDPDRSLSEQGFDLRAALLWDMGKVLSSDLVVVLHGYQASAGARAEVALAVAAEIPWMTLASALAQAGTS